jgi:FRG domain
MRDSIILKRASSLIEYIRVILKLRDLWYSSSGYDLWYRGVNNSRLPLLPGAYWRKDCEEETLFYSFQNLVPSYIDREPSDEWEWYYLMQHYGLPTRLLDWTENPLVGLYFAVYQYRKRKNVEPCVWMMDPGNLNRITQQLDVGYVIVPGGRGTSFWLPEYCGRGKKVSTIVDVEDLSDNSKPIAIYPKRYNPRIVAQQGVFTIHGIEEASI